MSEVGFSKVAGAIEDAKTPRATPMTNDPRDAERDAIVAWLRENIKECERLATLMTSQGSFLDGVKMGDVGRSQEGIAQAIERNEHRKGDMIQAAQETGDET